MLLHHQPPGRNLDRPVLPDLAADRNRLTCPLVHARPVCPLSHYVATSTNLEFNGRPVSAPRGPVDSPSTAVPGTSPPHPRHSRMTRASPRLTSHAGGPSAPRPRFAV